MDLPLVEMKVIYWSMQKKFESKLINLTFVAMNFIQNLRLMNALRGLAFN